MAKVFIEETTLSAIGDAIREKEGSTELVPVAEMASRIKNIETGSVAGATVYHLNELANVCRGVTFPENTELTVNVKSASNASLAFMETKNLKSVKLVSEDTTSSVNMLSAFRESAQLELVDLTEFNRKISNIQFFIYASNVKKVLGALDVSACTAFPATTFGSSNSPLQEIRFVGTISADISFHHNNKLSQDSFYSIRDHLSDSVTGKTVTFNAGAAWRYWFYHQDMGDDINGGAMDESWESEFCSAKPNWTFTLV